MSSERTVLCLVCGKKFPRGVLDLARHTTAITLQHLISHKPKSGYDFHCAKCELYFTAKAHLELHQQSVCPVKDKQRHSKSSSPIAKGKVKKEADESEEEEEDDTTERTMECVVCGKLFPRGPIDLARHQTAVTLKHLVHPRHTATYHFGCKRCGSHFTTAEHLAMHTEQSTCNPEMVWPTTVAPGAKCITRAEAAELDAAEAAGIHTAAEQAKVKATKDVVKKVTTPAKAAPALVDPTTGKLPKRAAAVAAVQVTPVPPSQSKNKQNQQNQQAQQVPQQSSHSNQQPISGRRGRDSISGEGSTELYFPKTKRAKVIVPEDRKAFFAVVSLLIDPEEVPESEKLTEDNYEAFLPPQHKKLVDALKATLYCTC